MKAAADRDPVWKWPGDPSAPGSGLLHMQSLDARPEVLHEYLLAVASGVVRPGSPESRIAGRKAALADAVSRLWVIRNGRPFRAALGAGLTVRQAHAYLSRSLARDLAAPRSGVAPESIHDVELPTVRPEDDPATAASARDLSGHLSRRLSRKCRRLLLARLAIRDAGDGWGSVEKALGLSSGTRKRIWNRAREVLETVPPSTAGSGRVWLLALRTMVVEERRDETRRETRRDETRRETPPFPPSPNFDRILPSPS